MRTDEIEGWAEQYATIEDASSASPLAIYEALVERAPAELRAWIQAHDADVLDAVARGFARRRGARPKTAQVAVQADARSRETSTMALDYAVRWAINAASELANATVFEQGNMIEDERGASMSTYNSLLNYADTPSSADIATHMAAIETLRTHSGRQLDRATWENAYAAIKAAYQTQYGSAEPPSRVFNTKAGPPSGYQDGSTFKWGGSEGQPAQFAAKFPYRRTGVKVNDLLSAAGIPRSAFQWVADTPNGIKNWLRTSVEWADRIADAVAAEYPILAAALRQNAPIWQDAAGVKPVGVSGPTSGAFGSTSPAPSALDPVRGSIVDGGRPDSFQWEVMPDRTIRVMLPWLKKTFTTVGLAFRWDDEKRGLNQWWARFPLTGDTTNKLIDVLRIERRPEAMRAVEAMKDTWRRIAMGEIAVAGAEPAVADEEEEIASEAPSDPNSGMIPVRGYTRIRYEWQPTAFRVLFSGEMHAKAWAAQNLGDANNFTQDNGQYKAVLFTEPALYDASMAAAPPALAAWFAAMRDTWVAASAFAQSREEGQAAGGRWKLVTTRERVRDPKTRLMKEKVREFVDVTMARLPPELLLWDRGNRRWTGSLVKWMGPTRSSDGITFRLSIGPRATLPKFIDVLRENGAFPRLVEALNRAFGGMHVALDDDEAERCAPLVAMHTAIGPQAVTDPVALERIAEVQAAFAKAPAYDRSGKLLQPLDFQWVGIAYAKQSGYRCLIADVMGLGKTIQGLGCVIADPEENLPCLVVGPANVVYNWTKEIRKWTAGLGKLPITVLVGSNTVKELAEEDVGAVDGAGGDPTAARRKRKAKANPQRRRNNSNVEADMVAAGGRIPRHSGFYVCSWDTLRERVEELAAFGFKLVIADEAHYAKDPKSARSKALAKMAEAVEHIVLLTGTPFKNAVWELHTLLAMVNPEAWGKQAEFKKKFTVTKVITTETGVKIEQEVEVNQEALPELRTRLACTLIRRQKGAVLKNLPKKYRDVIPVELTPSQRATFKEAEDRFEQWLERETERRIRAALEASGVDPATVREDLLESVRAKVESAMKAEVIVQLGEMRQLAGQFKAPHAARAALALGEPVLLWCHHGEVVDALVDACTKAGITFEVIDGSVSSEERQRIADDFQDGLVQVLICSMAAREGLTLTRARYAIFVERYWTPADESQAEDRIYRIGQTRDVTIYYMHSDTAIDIKMASLVAQKQDKVDQVLGDDKYTAADRDESQTAFVKHVRNPETWANIRARLGR